MRPEESRVLVIAPVGHDAEAMAGMLRAEGVTAESCAGVGECLEAMARGAGAVLLTEEALELPGAEELLEGFRRQPAWSELPLIILTSGGESRFARLLEIAEEVAGGITLLERPMRAGTLLHSVKVALRSRQRQYQVRDLLAERKRAEEALRESERRLRLITDRAPVMLGHWDPEHRFKFANATFASRFGLSPEQVIGKHLRDVVGEQAYEKISPWLEKGLRGEISDYELEVGYFGRSPEWMRVTYTRELGPDGEVLGIIGAIQDISKRKEMEGTLRESERRVRTFFDSEMMGALYWNMDGQITEANSKFLQMVGYTREDLASGRLNWAQMTPPDYASSDAYALEEIKTRGVETPYEKEYIRKDGSRVPILIGAAMLDDNRQEGVAFVLDITERKRAEEALRHSEERVRTIMETAQVAILVAHDSECRRVTGNSTAHALLGVPADGNLSGTPGATASVSWRALSGGRELAGEELPMQRAARTGKIIRHLELQVVRGTGERAAILATAAPLRDAAGAVTGAVGTLLDITERKRVEDALRQANERLAYHVQNTPLAVVEFDAELKVCAWNEGAERIFGWEAAEIVGRHMWEIPWICEEDRGKLKEVAAGLESGRMVRSVSPNRNLRKDGQVVWCEWYNSSLKDESGKMQSIQSLVLDVTKRKEAEAVLARDKEQLERLVAERTAELRELVGELEHFSYSITHDMRAPLRAMMGFAEVAKELCSGCERQEQKMFLDRIQTGAKRMDLLVTDALNYSKAVRSELPLAPIDVGRLLRGMVHTYPELQVAEGGIRIEPDLPLVMGNEAGLTQCFSNLLGNAVKFVKPGEAPDIRVWAELIDNGGSGPGYQPSTINHQLVRIWVEDRGIGIKAKMLPRVFDMFARGSAEQAGTGIGLALVRKVMQRMGGWVGVESEEGKGSRFWVELRSGDVRGRPGAERET